MCVTNVVVCRAVLCIPWEDGGQRRQSWEESGNSFDVCNPGPAGALRAVQCHARWLPCIIALLFDDWLAIVTFNLNGLTASGTQCGLTVAYHWLIIGILGLTWYWLDIDFQGSRIRLVGQAKLHSILSELLSWWRNWGCTCWRLKRKHMWVGTMRPY